MAAIKLVQVLEIFRIIGKQKPELVLLVYALAEITDIEQISARILEMANAVNFASLWAEHFRFS